MSITVVKRDGSSEIFDLSKIEVHVKESCKGLRVNPDALLEDVFKQCRNGIKTSDIQRVLITTAAEKISLEEEDWSLVAARATLQDIFKEVTGGSFRYPSLKSYLKKGVRIGVLSKELTSKFDLTFLDSKIDASLDSNFHYLGLITLLDRYFVRDENLKLLELPQHFWMRVAMGLALAEDESVRNQKAAEFYEVMANFEYIPSTPTLFNSGTNHPQLSSCYLTSMGDDTGAMIGGTLLECALDSKFAGGVAVDLGYIRSRGSYIRSTRGKSAGVNKYAHLLQAVFNGWDQGGKRKGVVAPYLPDYHGDLMSFLDVKDVTGDFRERAIDTFPAIWHSDLFMKRVEKGDETWSVFDPNKTPGLHDAYGQEFEDMYLKLEEEGKAVFTYDINDVWRKRIGKSFEHGVYFAGFKDEINRRRMQLDGIVHSSNLCTEITLNTRNSSDNNPISAVCNLGSINMSKVCPLRDRKRFEYVVKTAVRMLDNVVKFGFVPHKYSKLFNNYERAIGLGIMGYTEWLASHGIDFESKEHLHASNTLMKYFTYYGIEASCDIAEERGAYPGFKHSRWAKGELPKDTAKQAAIDLVGGAVSYNLEGMDEEALRIRVAKGVANSHIFAIAPTATISNIVNTIECTQLPYQLSYIKENLSGTFNVIAPTLKYRFMSPKTARSIDQNWAIDAAAVRQIWLDQAQSLNLYIPTDRDIEGREIGSWYISAWKKGVKTVYYLKGVSASEKASLNKVDNAVLDILRGIRTSVDGVDTPKICSLDNPGCESCQ